MIPLSAALGLAAMTASAGASDLGAGVRLAAGSIGAAAAVSTAEPMSDNLFGNLRIELDGRYMYGKIDGFLQTPAGGQPGTTSANRPAFDELGFDNVDIFDASLSARWDRHIFAVGGRFVHLDGDATLANTLISQNVTYPAGSTVSADVQLDWYRLGYAYQFAFDADDHGNTLTLAPGLEAVLFDFHYQLDGPGGLRTDRAYRKGGLRVGATAEWLTAGPLSVEAGAFWGVPITRTAEVLSLELIGRYQLWGERHSGGAAYVGVAYDEIDYQDDQAVPNHIKVQMGPLLIAGFEITF